MDRRAFLGAAAAGMVVGPAALAAGQVICRENAGALTESGPTTIDEFRAWLGRQFNVVKWVDEVTAMDVKHHAIVVSKSVEWIDDTDGLVMAAERHCVRSAALLIQSAIDLNPKAFGADLLLRRSPHVFVERDWDADTKFMKLRLRFSCSEPLPGITCPVPHPSFSKVDRNAWWIQTPAPVRS